MKLRTSLLILLSLLIVLPACGGKKTTKKRDVIETLSGPTAESAPVPERTFADPAPNETLYLAYIRGANNKKISGAMVQVLNVRPEAMDMRQPRRKTSAGSAISGKDGVAAILIPSDGKEKYLWVGGDGVPPVAYKAQAAAAGQRVKVRCDVKVAPIAHLIFTDHQGMRANNGIITFKPIGGAESAQKGDRPNQNDNYGTTRRANGMGEVKYTCYPGKFGLIATTESGAHRLYKIVDWDGDMSKPLEFQLPETSMARPAWYK